MSPKSGPRFWDKEIRKTKEYRPKVARGFWLKTCAKVKHVSQKWTPILGWKDLKKYNQSDKR
jgi:hypothetical protein